MKKSKRNSNDTFEKLMRGDVCGSSPRNFQPVVNLDAGTLLSQVHIAVKNTMGITRALDLDTMFTNARK